MQEITNLRKFVLFLIIPLQLSSQPVFDVLNIKYQYFPSQYFKDGSDKKSSSETGATLMIPFIQKDSSTILTGVNYKRIFSNDALNAFSLYSCALNIGYDYKWKNKKWSTIGLFIPKISADEFSLSGNNVQLGGAVLFKFKRSVNTQYNIGLYYNREVFGNYFIPLLGISWKASDRINVYGNMPAALNIEYKICSSFYTGISYSSITGTYRLHGNLEDYYIKEGERKIGYTQLRLILNWYVKKSFLLFLEPGLTYKRSYRLYNYSDEKLTYNSSGAQSKTNDGFMVMAGIAYRIRLDK